MQSASAAEGMPEDMHWKNAELHDTFCPLENQHGKDCSKAAESDLHMLTWQQRKCSEQASSQPFWMLGCQYTVQREGLTHLSSLGIASAPL